MQVFRLVLNVKQAGDDLSLGGVVLQKSERGGAVVQLVIGIKFAQRQLGTVMLLDNFDVPAMKQAVAMVAGRLVIEASGGITLDNIAAIAATGVDYASSGALTHSSPSLDVALDIEM